MTLLCRCTAVPRACVGSPKELLDVSQTVCLPLRLLSRSSFLLHFSAAVPVPKTFLVVYTPFALTITPSLTEL